MKPIAIVGLLTLASCAYERSAGRRDASGMPFVYDAWAWDSGLAYGIAQGDARHSGREGEPDAVKMDCTMYGVKPLIMGALLGAALAIADKGHAGLAIAPAGLVIPTAFIPNCHATLGYFYRAAQPRAVAPPAMPAEPPDLPMPRKPRPPAETTVAPAAVPPTAPAQKADGE